MMHFDVVPLNDLRDPFDRLILATAVQLGVPLGTADRAMSNTKTTEIIW
jgi:PIN domain nuclease of toxin-antitoxin system